MASGSGEGSLFLLSDDDDDLQEVPMNPPRRNENARGNLILPQPETIRTTRAQRTTSRRSNQRATPLQQPPAVIDLTDEPDSPVRERRSRSQAQDRRSHSTAQGGRNPRRTNSQRISPPTLARSDGTFMGRSASFIDLTADSPPEGRPSGNLRSRVFPQPPPAPPRHPYPHPFAPRPRPDELIELEIIETAPRSLPGSLPGFAIGISRRIAGILGRSEYLPFPAMPTGFPTATLDFTRAAWAPRESPKPPMEPIPPTRSGFTRNTCAEPEEDENIVICPACNEELAYDPTDTAMQTASGAKKRKRAAGEHHFWALKKCGHVYCADCFENRKPTTKNRGVGFRLPHSNSSVNDLRCAVEECNTKALPKGEWVGIFL